MRIKNISNNNLFRHNNRLYWKTGDYGNMTVVVDMATGNVEKLSGDEQLDSLIGKIEMELKPNGNKLQRQTS